jgi:hypothetical protein
MEDNLRARLLIREGLELDSLDVHAVLLLGLVAMSWLGYREKRNGRGDLVGFCIGLVRPVVGRGTAGSSGMGAPSYVHTQGPDQYQIHSGAWKAPPNKQGSAAGDGIGRCCISEQTRQNLGREHGLLGPIFPSSEQRSTFPKASSYLILC